MVTQGLVFRTYVERVGGPSTSNFEILDYLADYCRGDQGANHPHPKGRGLEVDALANTALVPPLPRLSLLAITHMGPAAEASAKSRAAASIA